jgi:hypothetical protein
VGTSYLGSIGRANLPSPTALKIIGHAAARSPLVAHFAPFAEENRVSDGKDQREHGETWSFIMDKCLDQFLM